MTRLGLSVTLSEAEPRLGPIHSRKINRGGIQAKILRGPLKLISLFLIQFLLLIAVPGGSFWVR